MSDRDVMKQALEALKKATKHLPVHFDSHFEAIATLRAALAKDALQRLTDVQQEIEAALDQPEQEPVALIRDGVLRWHIPHEHYARPGWTAHGTHMLYAQPPQRKPLTDEDIEQAQRTVWRSLPSDFDYTTSSWIEIGIRYAEAAHGIKE